MHTRVKFWVKPYREKREYLEHIFENMEFKTVPEVREYMEYGNPGNYVIVDAISDSHYGCLDSWGIQSATILSDEVLEHIDFIRESERVIKAAKKQAREDRKKTKELQAKADAIDKENKKMLDKLGWSSLTFEEVEWACSEMKSFFLKPSAQQ